MGRDEVFGRPTYLEGAIWGQMLEIVWHLLQFQARLNWFHLDSCRKHLAQDLDLWTAFFMFSILSKWKHKSLKAGCLVTP